MSTKLKLNPSHQLPWLALGLVELALSYAFINLAFDRGSWWWYLLMLVFLVLGVKNVISVIAKIIGVLAYGR